MTFAETSSPASAGLSGSLTHKSKLAVVAMEVILGASQGLRGFERAVFYGQSLALTGHPLEINLTSAERGWLRLDGLQAAQLSLENALLLKTVAMAQSHLVRIPTGRGALYSVRASELVAAAGMRFFPEKPVSPHGELMTAQFHNCANPLFCRLADLSLEGNPLAYGLREAQHLIKKDEVDYAVLAGAAVITPEITEISTKAGIRLHAGAQTLGFDRTVDGWIFGEGALAVILMDLNTALAEKHTIFAVVEGAGYASKDLASPKKHIIPTFVSSETITQSCLQAFSTAGIDPLQVGYLETMASGFGPLDTAEITGLAKAYAHSEADLDCALGSFQLQGGFLPAISAFAGFGRAALCLYNRFLPAAPAWNGPKRTELYQNTSFYVPTDPRTWFLAAPAHKRVAAVNAIGWDGSCAHILLSEDSSHLPRTNQFLVRPAVSIFPVAGNSVEDLVANLKVLNDCLEDGLFYSTALSGYQKYQSSQNSPFAACLVAQDLPELRKEIASALRDIPASFEKKKPWQTLAGSFFTPEPAGTDAGIAFVYPGAFNSYVGLGRDLMTLFPEMYTRAERLTSDIALTIQDRKLYPRSLEALSKEQIQSIEAQLNADPIGMITSGSLISVLFTMILRDIFKVHPTIALGYSLGEIGMLIASGIWDQPDAVRAKLHTSPLFPERLSGPQAAIREYWQLPNTSNTAPIWANYFLMTAAEQVINVLKHHPRVFLTHINTPRQVVIGGDPLECQQVIAELKCTSLRAPFDFALHCEAMRSEYDRLVEMLTWPVGLQPQTRLYTAAGFQPLAMDSRLIAEKISSMLCTSLDFSSLVRKTYADGARIFIELGANANCTRWIEDILKGEAFTAVAINRRGVDDLTSISRTLARLVSNRVHLNLDPLFLSA